MSQFIKVTFIIFTLIVGKISLAQGTAIDSLDYRVNILEDYQGNIEKLYELNSKELNKNLTDKIEAKMSDLEEQKKTIGLLLWVGIPSTIIGLLAVYFGAIYRAKKLIVDKIETIVEQKREDIIKLIETQEFDTKLRKTKKLIVLSTSEVAHEKIQIFFPKFKFHNVKYRLIHQYTHFSDYDLIVFNDLDASFPQEIIDDYLNSDNTDDLSFVAFTVKNLKRDPRINFSNSRLTLYHSILTTLKYTEILKLTDNID